MRNARVLAVEKSLVLIRFGVTMKFFGVVEFVQDSPPPTSVASERYDRLLEQLIVRHGKQSGTRQMIQVISLVKQYGHQRLRAAIEGAVALGCWDAAAIRHLVQAAELGRERSALIELGE